MVYVIQVCWQLAVSKPVWHIPYTACCIWYMVYSLLSANLYDIYHIQLAVSKPVWHIPLLCVQWKTPDDGQGNCLKHVEFYSKNKFEKLVHLVGFIIRIHHDARSLKPKKRWYLRVAWRRYSPHVSLLVAELSVRVTLHPLQKLPLHLRCCRCCCSGRVALGVPVPHLLPVSVRVLSSC